MQGCSRWAPQALGISDGPHFYFEKMIDILIIHKNNWELKPYIRHSDNFWRADGTTHTQECVPNCLPIHLEDVWNVVARWIHHIPWGEPMSVRMFTAIPAKTVKVFQSDESDWQPHSVIHAARIGKNEDEMWKTTESICHIEELSVMCKK